jgi:2-keto-4-pentenoate hydratase/2-oxohepta-3-ene-1,7-dioic acid hydratase in catechol pathway
MRIIRFEDKNGQIHTGEELSDGRARPFQGDLFGDPKPGAEAVDVKRLLAPVLPPNIFCIGLNYREHAKEGGKPIPEYPVVFMKPTTALADPGQAVLIPKACDENEVDYECELCVVIGKTARNVSVSNALDHVFGYTAANDISARIWQSKKGGSQWIRGKSFDTFCPIGPALVTADEIPDPQVLNIKTIFNGEVLQNHTTGDMIFSVAELIEFLSRDTTLLPGTLLLTGTPQGVGFARKPPVYLKPDDQMIIEVEKIGQLINPVARG